MYAPGFYKTDRRRLTIREMVRWYGWRRLIPTFIATRSTPECIGVWMPAYWADLECTEKDLSDLFWRITKSHRESFQRLGFQECGFAKLKPHMNLNPNTRDNGKITYLDPTRTQIGVLLFSKMHSENFNQHVHLITVWFTAAFNDGGVHCSNNRFSFDPIPGETVMRVTTNDPALIHEQFVKLLEKRADKPRQFGDDQSLRAWFDENQIKAFECRVKRRLFVKMTDQEIAAARQRFSSEQTG